MLNINKLTQLYKKERKLCKHFGLSKEKDEKDTTTTLKLHCLTPKLAFKSLTDENPANILITSGTL